MKIILIRHGMTEGNLKRRYIGTTDEDLINTDCLKGDYPKCERIVASPNGETHEDFKNRCKDGFFESLTERDTAFVIHGGSIMAIMQKLFGGNFYDYQVKNGCGYEFEMRNGEIVDDYSPIGCG